MTITMMLYVKVSSLFQAKQEAARKAEEKRKADLEAARRKETADREKENEKISSVPAVGIIEKKPEKILSVDGAKPVEKPEVVVAATDTGFHFDDS